MALILHSVWPLLRESALILLQTVPTHIEVDAIQQRLLEKVDGVLAVHEFHVWQLAGDRIIASAHIRYLLTTFLSVRTFLINYFFVSSIFNANSDVVTYQNT